MKGLSIAFALAFFTALAEAIVTPREIPQGVDTTALMATLKSKGYSVFGVQTIGDKTYILMDSADAKDPNAEVAPFIDTDTKAMRVLAKRIKDGTASSDDRDNLLLLLTRRAINYQP